MVGRTDSNWTRYPDVRRSVGGFLFEISGSIEKLRFRLSLILFIPNCLCLCLIEDFLVVLNSNDCRKAQINIYTCPACINFLFTSFCRERIVWPLHLNIKRFYYYHTLLVLPCGGFQQVETAAAVVYHGEINELPQNASPRDCYTRLVNEVIIVSRRSLYRKS